MLRLPKATRTAFCSGRCNQDMPYKRVPLLGKHGPLKKKVAVCLICETRVHVQAWSTAKPTMGTTGKMRQSQAEAAREDSLVELQKIGAISNLRMCNDEPRETFSLNVYSTPIVEALLERIEAMPPEMCVGLHKLARQVRLARHHVQNYTPDFSWDDQHGRRHWTDEKGRTEKGFSKIRTLMLACHGIEVEVTRMSSREIRAFKRKRGL